MTGRMGKTEQVQDKFG